MKKRGRTDSPWIVDGKDAWAEFLRIRKLVINAMVGDGDDYAKIANALSMDPMQVQLIALTDPAAPEPHSK